MPTIVAALFILPLAIPVGALAGPEDWSDFTNNFATDLAPIIVLFGEQASKQFLSESTSFWDNIVFGIAPIGIITAVVSAIRLYGSSSLKAFIGRAQEAHGAAEAELCSSTSEDVCELWSNGGICRVFGRPRILEFFHIKNASIFYPSFEHRVDTKTPPSCGLYPPQSVLCADELRRRDGVGTHYPTTGWREIGNKDLHPPHNDTIDLENPRRPKAFAPHPNLSLNIGITRVKPHFLGMTVVLGTALQLSFFGYATWATFYHPELYEIESLPSLWSFCLTISGTVVLGTGMICCAMLIERISRERRFRDFSQKTQMFWLQPGNQRVGDQLFNAFAYSGSMETYITSWKVNLEGESKEPGILRLNEHSFRLWMAIACSICGFIGQFLGLRGLHGSVALYQLGVTLCMAIARSLLRSGRLGADKNKLGHSHHRNVEGHELDWQATNLERPAKEFKGGWYIDDLPSPLQRPKDNCEQEKSKLEGGDDGIDVARKTQQIVSFRIRRDRNIDTLQSANTAVSWIKQNEAMASGDGPNEAARILHYRTSLAYLTGEAIQAAEQRWNTDVRAMAKQLQGALQDAAEYIFSEMALEKGWRESRSLVWSTTCRLHEPPTLSDLRITTTTNTTIEGQPSQAIHFSMHHNQGFWEISECQVEAALGLWYWSVSQLPGAASRSFRRKVFMAEQAEKRNALISTIRLWVTRTHRISSIHVKLPQTLDPPVPETRPPIDGNSRSSTDGTLASCYYPTTLSVPLMTLFDRVFARQDEGGGSATQDESDLDGICLSIPTQSSLLQLVSQDIFGIFISRIADVLEPLDVVEPRTRRSRVQTFGVEAATADQSFVGLTNSHVRALEDVFVSSGIGSREDALMTMIPPLLQRAKLPETHKVMNSLLHTARTLRRNSKFTQAESLLRWLVDNVPRPLQETAVKCLGDLYRKAVRSSHPYDREFGRVGFTAMETMEALSEDRELFPESKAMIKSYLLALPTLGKNTGRDSKEPLGTLIEKLDATTPARPLGLYLVDKYDVAGATTEDMLSLLNWAVLVGCQELIEDLWKFRRGLAAMAGTKSGPSPIFPAIHSNDSGSAETIKALLDWPRFEPNPCWNGKSALAVASEIGHDRAVELLLEHGVSPNDPDGSALVLSIRNKHLRVVQCLVKAGADTNLTVDSREEEGSPGEIKTTALHSAIGWDNSVVKLLLEHRANPDSSKYSGGKTPLFLAAEVGDIESVNLLLKYGAKVEATDDNGAYPVLTAIERGHHDIVKLLIENMPISNIFQVLPVAIRSAQQKVVDLLLAQGADPTVEDDEGSPLLLVAVEKGVEGITKTLLAAGAKTNARSADGSTSPLHAAIRSGNWQILSALLDPVYEADVNLKVKEWQTPLALAVNLGHSATVRLLLQRGANPDAECHYDSEGEGPDGIGTVLHLVAACGNLEIVNLLLEAGASPAARDHAGRTPLLLVMDRMVVGTMVVGLDPADEMILERLLRAGASPNVVQQEGAAVAAGDGSTALHLAIAANSSKAVDLLLEHGADLEARDGAGLTPLHLAIAANSSRAVDPLLKHGADLEARDGAGRTPLLAVLDRPYRSREQTVLARQLLAAGANPNATVEGSDGGSTALHLAVAGFNEEAIDLLLQHGANLEARDGAGHTPLMAVMDQTFQGTEQTVMALQLLAAGANPNATGEGSDGASALQAAARLGHEEVVHELLSLGADVNQGGARYGSALQAAASGWAGEEVVQMLLAAGADITAVGGEHGSALHAALAVHAVHGPGGSTRVLEMLLRHPGVDAELVDSRGLTPLLKAVVGKSYPGRVDVVKLLLEHGASTEAAYGERGTALLIAAADGDARLVEVLLQYGADKEARDGRSRTALLVACEKGHREVAKLLLDARADVTTKGGLYGTAMQGALYRGDGEMIALLERWESSLA